MPVRVVDQESDAPIGGFGVGLGDAGAEGDSKDCEARWHQIRASKDGHHRVWVLPCRVDIRVDGVGDLLGYRPSEVGGIEGVVRRYKNSGEEAVTPAGSVGHGHGRHVQAPRHTPDRYRGLAPLIEESEPRGDQGSLIERGGLGRRATRATRRHGEGSNA